MIINSHAHIFNFKSQNTAQTRLTLINRLTNEGWPTFLVKAVEKVFDKVLSDEYMDEEQLLRKLLKALKMSDKFKEFVDGVGGALPGEIGIIIHGDLDGLKLHGLRKLFRKLSASLSRENDIGEADVEDLLDFLLIGIKPRIADVANILMEQTPENDAVVALMMDITKGGTNSEDRFLKQASDTSRAALAHPGRILPFFAVNPNRTNHLKFLKEAVETQGFVGVKLYPSLGYKVNSAAMRKVYQYCIEKSLPVLTHCNQGGFYFKKSDISLCAPSEFIPVLQSFPELKICFAHFGGDEELVETNLGEHISGWTREILDLMTQYSGVYADISYHTGAMDGGVGESNYFANLKRLIDDSDVGGRILYGSDFQLVRQRAREENYRGYFEQHLGPDHFRKVAEKNSATYLGMPSGDGTGAASNIIEHAQFLAGHNTDVGAMPLPWVPSLLKAETGRSVAFIPNPFGLEFSTRNPAHYYTSWFFALLHTPQERQSLTFEKLGHMQIRDLPGWPIESGDYVSRAQTFLSFAKELRMYMEKPKRDGGPGAKLELGVSGTKAQNKLKALFARGSDSVYKFGDLVDGIYKFPEEQMNV